MSQQSTGYDEMMTPFAQQRLNMLECQIRPFSVIDDKILDAYATVPRENYLPQAMHGIAYLDGNLPLGGDRFLVDAASHARLVQGLEIVPGVNPRILDIGCLGGYTTALLARLTPEAIGLDTADWVRQANATNTPHTRFFAGDPAAGLVGEGPFDMIVINGAVQHIPPTIAAQLKDNGKLATFSRDPSTRAARAVIYHKQKGILREQVLFDAFIPLLPGFAVVPGFVF